MIAIQIILIIGFFFLLVRFLSTPGSHQIKAWKKILGILFAGLAIVAVLTPEMLNRVAGWVGVGRGADLLLYLLSLAFIFVTLNLYVKDRQDQKKFVSLVRKVAIMEATARYRTKD